MSIIQSANRIHVYSVHIEQDVAILDDLHELNQIESQRCEKFYRHEDQMRCAIAADLNRAPLLIAAKC
jgi:hypothetical protein